MSLTGPQKIPFAVTAGSSWYGDNYTGTPFEANVGVAHTTEGTSLPDYGGGASAPNITGVPDFAAQKVKWYQHYDVDRSSRALRNASGGVETNQLNAFQVELVGTCDPATRDKWLREGRKFIYWPTAPDWALKEVGKLVRWLSDNHKIQIKSTVTWRAYPGSYGTFARQRLTGAQWSEYYGWLGHQHVPENDHGDPGDIDFDRIIQFALGLAPTEGEDVALTDAEIAKVAKAVWDHGISNRFRPDAEGDPKVIPARYFQEWSDSHFDDTQSAVAALESKVDSLVLGGIDLDALADKVADKLAARLAD